VTIALCAGKTKRWMVLLKASAGALSIGISTSTKLRPTDAAASERLSRSLSKIARHSAPVYEQPIRRRESHP
jgi:hypothetical protein